MNPVYQRYLDAERMLTARMVAEAYRLETVEEHLFPSMFSGENQVARTCLKLLEEKRSVALFILSQQSGTSMPMLAELSGQFDDVPLEMAVGEFVLRYGQWMEYQIAECTMAWIEKGFEPGKIQTEQEKMRREKRIGSARFEENNQRLLLDRLDAAFEGRIPFGKVEPPTKAMRKHKAFYEGGELTIIAGRPGMGKSKLALNLLLHNAQKGQYGTLFSLEMPGPEVMTGIWQMLGGQEFRYDLSHLAPDEKVRLRKIAEGIADMAFTVYTAEFGLAGILSKIRKLHQDKNLAFAIIDFLQLAEVEEIRANASREQVVATISRAIKKVGQELKIPMFALSSLNRMVETRGGSKRPILADLRDSGAVESDADNVIFVYRPEQYQILENERGESLKGVAELIYAKNRNGPVDTILSKFGHVLGFTDIPDKTPDYVFPKTEKVNGRSYAPPDNPIPF
jgi:hypothetical protein